MAPKAARGGDVAAWRERERGDDNRAGRCCYAVAGARAAHGPCHARLVPRGTKGDSAALGACARGKGCFCIPYPFRDWRAHYHCDYTSRLPVLSVQYSVVQPNQHTLYTPVHRYTPMLSRPHQTSESDRDPFGMAQARLVPLPHHSHERKQAHVRRWHGGDTRVPSVAVQSSEAGSLGGEDRTERRVVLVDELIGIEKVDAVPRGECSLLGRP